MNSLPTLAQYDAEIQNNNTQVSSLLTTLFPNLLVPHEDIYQLLAYLDQTSVNPQILPRVLRSVQNIMIGSGTGEVIVHVRGETTTIEAREIDMKVTTKKVETNI